MYFPVFFMFIRFDSINGFVKTYDLDKAMPRVMNVFVSRLSAGGRRVFQTMEQRSRLEKCEDLVNQRKYYEAHQMYRTVYNRYYSFPCHDRSLCSNGSRYLNRRDFLSAAEIAASGGRLLLQHKQYNSAADLGQLLIDAFKKGVPVSKESLEKIVFLFVEFPPGQRSRIDFMNSAIKSCYVLIWGMFLQPF